jgi:NSS family neurotransmitter:Na+ symporter
MMELDTRTLMDAGFSRKKAIALICVCAFVLGFPSAISMEFFTNQDWVWSLGLMVSGFFFTIAVLKFGPKNFRQNIVSIPGSKIRLKKWFDILVIFLLPLQFLAMLGWWFWKSYSGNPHNWFNIASPGSVGTVLFQWVIALGLFIMLNKIIAKKMLSNKNDS